MIKRTMKTFILSVLLMTFSFLSYSQLNMELLGHLPYNEELSDVWGYVDEEGNEYALVGVYNGLSIVDVTDPANPVEVFFGPGPNSIWRDMKTWGDYAYVSNESSGGVYIVDLGPLPGGDITTTANFTGSTYPFQTAHNLFIDESGKLYIFGADSGSGGAIICDLTQDPMNPVELGRFNDYYLHDGMARGDTLWGAAIYQGVLAAIDVSDPSSTVVMGTVSTPSQFAHNAWVSDDGSHVYTTDEVSGGYIGSFNVTDVQNMFEEGRIRSSRSNGVIPHNVHVQDDFLITSYYTDGIVVHDAKYPGKLFEVANFDTSPNFSGSGFSGSWGAYPFLPSGVILASDIEEGLYILDIDYTRAAYLEGVVTSEATGTPLFNVNVEVLGTGLTTQTAFDGTYEFGTLLSGTFDLQFSKPGYITQVIGDVAIINGEIVTQDAELETLSVGINDPDRTEAPLSVYPNPFTSSATLDYNLPEGTESTAEVSVYTLLGEKVMHFRIKGTEGSVEFGRDLPAGIYFIRLSNGSQLLKTLKIVKR
jgi:choice-of-anchor B domain-containing protein